GRAGRVVPHPVDRGCAGHVAVPLPRRGSHDAGDDRHLPGVGMRLLILAACLALFFPAAGEGAKAKPAEVAVQFSAYGPSQLDILPGQTVVWSNVSERTHTVTSDTGLFDSGHFGPGA